jgi:hypothetical protein
MRRPDLDLREGTSMKSSMSRRTVLRWMGLQLSLPLVSGLVADRSRAQETARKHFIAVYFPNGAHMPGGENGSWNFNEALAPLAGLRQHTMVVRGLFNGFSGIDPHWQNCAGFLSCHPIELGDPGIARCAKSLDQHVADAHPSPRHSLEIGEVYYHRHLLNDHPGYSHDYLNRISWQSADRYRAPNADPARLFARLFSDGSVESQSRLAYMRSRNQSILDHLHGDATRFAQRMPNDYRPSLEAYMQTVRELEQELAAPSGQCPGAPTAPTEQFSHPDRQYQRRFELLHEMVVIAMGCGLTNVATLMYGPSVSDDLRFGEQLGSGDGHHACAHHGGTAGKVERLKRINQVQVGLLADLLTRLSRHGLLEQTLVLYGSDMSDGDKHLTRNLPFLLCGGGSDLKFGQEVGSAERPRPLSDLYMEMLPLLGIDSFKSFGTGECQSTGMSLGLRV